MQTMRNRENETHSRGRARRTAVLAACCFLLLAVLAPANATDTYADDDIVIVLDPGHDATHTGARANGLVEEELTLKVAQYCRAALEEYTGVTVYMTRETADCPYSGTTSGSDIAKRVAYAEGLGADAYISLHFNSASATSAHGVSVYYPNANYEAQIGADGKALAQYIQDHLVALGLNDRGIRIRNSESGTQYADGSTADYYAVIRRAKLAGFPGLIVEHAFLTNSSDAAFLSSEENLQAIGEADAEAIAAYYGLTKSVSFSAEGMSITAQDTAAGTLHASVYGVTPEEKVEKVLVAVWSGGGEQIWYTAEKTGDGVYCVDVDLHNHGSIYGTYHLHAYAQAADGTLSFLAYTDTTIAAPADTEQPTETEAPIETETEQPTETEAPAETEELIETEAPVETTAPDETEAPDETTAPIETEAPDETEAPVETEQPIETALPDPLYYGDVNLDGTVGADDALAVLRDVVNLALLQEGMPQTLADAAHDGSIGADDALRILQVTVRLQEPELYAGAAESEAPTEADAI